jgi:hypothetical protein
MAPGMTLWASMQPFFIAIGDIIIVALLVFSVVVAVATFAYIVMRERGWWRDAEASTAVSTPASDSN